VATAAAFAETLMNFRLDNDSLFITSAYFFVNGYLPGIYDNFLQNGPSGRHKKLIFNLCIPGTGSHITATWKIKGGFTSPGYLLISYLYAFTGN
jgi:hypothetical protein